MPFGHQSSASLMGIKADACPFSKGTLARPTSVRPSVAFGHDFERESVEGRPPAPVVNLDPGGTALRRFAPGINAVEAGSRNDLQPRGPPDARDDDGRPPVPSEMALGLADERTNAADELFAIGHRQGPCCEPLRRRT